MLVYITVCVRSTFGTESETHSAFFSGPHTGARIAMGVNGACVCNNEPPDSEEDVTRKDNAEDTRDENSCPRAWNSMTESFKRLEKAVKKDFR
jgi:hypothetical protein